MIDIRAHELGLAQLRAAFGATSFGDPGLAGARDDLLADVAQAEGQASLGAVLDHVLTQAVSDGAELALLERAADLWRRGVGLYDVVGGIRADLERALSDPGDPASVPRFNTIAGRLHGLATALHALQGEAEDLRQDVAKLDHLPPHPRQQDEPVEQWDWGNLLCGRRTDAFVRSVFGLAGHPEQRAFAFGVLSGYAANVHGSAYAGRVVGGPRRSHRFRDRLARHAIGSWMTVNRGELPTLGQFVDMLAFGDADNPRLPAAVDAIVRDGLADAYDPGRSPPLPDLALGHRRLVRRLQLLDGFRMPPLPSMPSDDWPARIHGDPAQPPPPGRPRIVALSDDTGGGGGGDLGNITVAGSDPGDPQPDKSDSKASTGTLCAIALVVAILFAIALVAAFVECVIQWANGDRCTYFDNLWNIITLEWTGITQTDPPDPGGPPDESQSAISAQGLAAFAPTEQAAHLVHHLWDLHVQLWEALERAHDYLSVAGLVYPDGRLSRPLYRQFLTAPPAADWPHRLEPDPHHTYHLFPTSPLENPPASEGAFAGEAPDAPFAAGGPATDDAIGLWMQIVAGSLDSSNRDLDADRGHKHDCWATDGSIDDDPVGVRLLAYDEQ
jgi:hypothetical protein